jgi:LmbE family N-acetylglucosaminyl deacetylase
MHRRALLSATGTLLLLTLAARAEQPLSGGLAVKFGLNRLQTLGSVLMIAAHPDDENTALLSYFAQGRHYRTAYLSLTRGEGGQNLIGSEQGALMGVIRTQELLAARRLDGADQFFTRAIDFGFSKTADETLRKWGRDQVLGDIVWTIRKFRPDVIVLRFSGTPRDGHGHHQSSAMLGLEAFAAAADPQRFPEQLRLVEPWKARRVFWNIFAFTAEMERQAALMPNRIAVDTGEYNAALGLSYGEIAGLSRSMHRSQGMGAPQRRGSQPQYLTLRAGDPATSDPFEGIDTTWKRVPGGDAVAAVLSKASAELDVAQPAKVIPRLLEARKLIAAIKHPWAAVQLRVLEEVLAQAAGIWLDAASSRYAIAPGSEFRLNVNAVNRSPFPVQLMAVRFTGMSSAEALSIEPVPLPNNRPYARAFTLTTPSDQAFSQPYWLRQPPSETLYTVTEQPQIGLAEGVPALQAHFRLRFEDQELELARPVLFRYVDAVRGELTRPLIVVPPVSVEFPARSVVFPSAAPRTVDVRLRATVANAHVDLRPQLPAGWRIEPASFPVTLKKDGETAAVRFTVYPPATAGKATLSIAGQVGIHGLNYEHIPPQTIFPEASITVVRTDAKLLSRKVGYVMGAGDEVPAALEQLGAEVTLLSPDDVARGNLGSYDAIVTGVRAYNVRADLRTQQQRFLDYVAAGGTLIVQYNVLDRREQLESIGPYPLTVSRDRVSVEDSPMRAVAPDAPLLQAPNRITDSDYDGWVQERGLYFATKWDPRYQPLWQFAEPNEKPTQGGTLSAKYGKGVYIFTPLSWFRQLPAGVPGAYRIFANFLSAAKATP